MNSRDRPTGRSTSVVVGALPRRRMTLRSLDTRRNTKKDGLGAIKERASSATILPVRDNWSCILQKSLSLSFLPVSFYQHMFMNTFRSTQRLRNAIRDDLKRSKLS